MLIDLLTLFLPPAWKAIYKKITYALATHLVFFAFPSPGQNPFAATEAIISEKAKDFTNMSEINEKFKDFFFANFRWQEAEFLTYV